MQSKSLTAVEKRSILYMMCLFVIILSYWIKATLKFFALQLYKLLEKGQENFRRLILLFCIISMGARRKILKFFIIIILAVFLLATGLTSVMYLAGNKNVAEVDSWAVADTGIVAADAVDTGVVVPTMTKEEAQKQLEQLLSGGKK